MKKKTTFVRRAGVGAAGLFALAIGAVSLSQDQEMPQMPAPEPAEHQIAPAFDPSAMDMERWMEASTPGEEHKMLDKLTGEWDLTLKMWMSPGAPPTVSEGTSTVEWVLDGRHIKEHMKSTMMGQPYEGIGYTSYDKYAGQYVMTWLDSMGTTVYQTRGFASMDGGAIVTYGTMDEPGMGVRGKTVKYVLRMVDDDTHVFEAHDLHIGEPNTKVMEITYERAE